KEGSITNMADDKPKKYSKPLPHIDEENRPWWEALKRHELYLQKCRDCGFERYYPRALCTNCMSSKTEGVRCSGRGKIYTFAVTNQLPPPGFRESLPYVRIDVELNKDDKMLMQRLDCPLCAYKIGNI